MSNHYLYSEDYKYVLLNLYGDANLLHSLNGTDYDQAIKDLKKPFDQETLDMMLLDIILFNILYPLDSQLTEAKLWHLFRLVLDLGASATHIHPIVGAAPIVICVMFGKLKETEELLKRGANPDTTYMPDGQEQPGSCLEEAVIRGNTEMVGILIKYGAETRLNDLLFLAAEHCPDNLEMIPLLVERNGNSLTIGDADHEMGLPLIRYMFRASWTRYEEREISRGNTDSSSLLMGSERIMKNVVYLMAHGWPAPTVEMIGWHVFAERYGSLVEYILGCLDNGLPIVIPEQPDFEEIDREWVLTHLIAANRGPLFPRGKSTLAAIISRILCHPEKIQYFLSQLGDTRNVPRLEDVCIAKLRNLLTDRHAAIRFRVVSNALPLPPGVINKLNCHDLRMKFKNEMN